MRPPTIHTLLEDPVYRAYLKQIPRLSPNLVHGEPWVVWARTTDEPARWAKKMCTTYREAWGVLRDAMGRPDRYNDVAIVSRRQLFAPPENFYWDYPFHWCSRCRRPSMFAYRPKHHALKNAPVVSEDPDDRRCFYCGMRSCAMPTYDG